MSYIVTMSCLITIDFNIKRLKPTQNINSSIFVLLNMVCTLTQSYRQLAGIGV